MAEFFRQIESLHNVFMYVPDNWKDYFRKFVKFNLYGINYVLYICVIQYVLHIQFFFSAMEYS